MVLACSSSLVYLSSPELAFSNPEEARRPPSAPSRSVRLVLGSLFVVVGAPVCRGPLPVGRVRNWLGCNSASYTTTWSQTRNRPSGSCW